MRFAAATFLRGERLDGGKPLWELFVLCVEAESEEEARGRAADLAAQREVEYVAADGCTIRWRFECVGQVQHLDPEGLKDGSDILSIFLRNDEAVSILTPIEDD